MSEHQNLDDYYMAYAKAFLQNSNNMWSYLLDPQISNQILKSINMNPVVRSRDEVLKLIADPKNNEQALRRLAEYFYDTNMSYKTLVHYLSNILTFDYIIVPIGNVPEEEKKNKEFLKDLNKAFDFFDKFDHMFEFRKALRAMVKEDVKYTYIRESGNVISLQEMPSDYCVIDKQSIEGDYLYSFNMMYFMNMGVDISGFASEFRKYLSEFYKARQDSTYRPYKMRIENHNGRHMYWQQMDKNKSYVFKFHDDLAGCLPLYLGLFPDLAESDSYKRMQKIKMYLETVKFIFGTIPMNKETKSGGNIRDAFAISPKVMGEFAEAVTNTLPEGAFFKNVPAEDLKIFDFNNTESKKDIMERYMKTLYQQAGVDQSLFNSEKPNASTMKASTRIDTSFIEAAYSQFNRFCSMQINQRTKKYKFKVIFNGTIFDQEERKKEAREDAQSGILSQRLAASHGLNIRQFIADLDLVESLDLRSRLKPIQTSSTISSKESGRPETDNPDNENTELGKDAGSNDNKKAGG
ncbi:MAG: hypothetical protein WDA21_04490 [Bacilli bacterium]